MKQLELYYKINSSVGINSYISLNTLIKHVVITSFTTSFIRWHVFDLKFDVKIFFYIQNNNFECTLLELERVQTRNKVCHAQYIFKYQGWLHTQMKGPKNLT